MNKKERLKKELKKLLKLQQKAEDFEIDAYQCKQKGFYATSSMRLIQSGQYYLDANEQKKVLIQLINEL